jgi:hypothetical protein
MKVNFFFICSSFLFFQLAFAQYTDVINSNRPGSSMSAYSVGKKVIQIESGMNLINEKNDVLESSANGYSLDVVTRYGIYKEELEAIMDINYQSDTYNSDEIIKKRTGIKSSTLGFKYLIYDPFKNYEDTPNLYSWKANHKFKWHQFIPAVSGYAGVNFNLSESPFLFPDEKYSRLNSKVMVVTQNIFTGAWVFVTNLFLDKISTNNQSLGYVLTFTKGFNDQWSGFVENKGIKGNCYTDGIFTVGAAYLFNKNLQMDASVSKNYNNAPSLLYGGVGISWRSDTNYQKVQLKNSNTDKKKDKSVKARDKEKAKKRLDEGQF